MAESRTKQKIVDEVGGLIYHNEWDRLKDENSDEFIGAKALAETVVEAVLGRRPALVRTVEDYQALPDGTILAAVDNDEGVLHKIDGRFGWAGYYGLNDATNLVQRRIKCRVVELGGA